MFAKAAPLAGVIMAAEEKDRRLALEFKLGIIDLLLEDRRIQMRQVAEQEIHRQIDFVMLTTVDRREFFDGGSGRLPQQHAIAGIAVQQCPEVMQDLVILRSPGIVGFQPNRRARLRTMSWTRSGGNSTSKKWAIAAPSIRMRRVC